MSTTTLNPTASPHAATLPSRAIIRRFAWKEYRVLRGLWLAVGVLGVLVQLTLNALLPPGPQIDDATILFIVAWGAAILYAAGAAAATFSVEHEEDTYGFLSGLPTTWWPMFVGKLIVAGLSAFALAAALAVTGAIFHLPATQNAAAISAACSVAILEAIAWGTLFSLLIKRPLVAAMLTLVVGGMALHLAVNLASSSTVASLNLNSYLDAIPLRLAIVAAVLAASALVARRWLPQQFPSSVLRGGVRGGVSGSKTRRGGEGLGEGSSTLPRRFLSSLSAHIATPVRSISTRSTRGARRRQTARLLWQTWHESWLWLPLPIVVGFALTAGTSLITYLTLFSDETESLLVASTLFVTPTLYGAMAFSADQRRSSYRFLAEHAARPRYVWLARHAVWLGAVILFSIVVAGVVAVIVEMQIYAHMADFDRFQESYGSHRAAEIIRDELLASQIALRIIGLSSCGILTAYALGQFWSMLMRSEIIAAFTALVLSVGLAAWVALLGAWDLPGRLFLLPIFVGLMLATWLRAPAWIADRRTWRAWLAPSLAIVVPLQLIAVALPTVRLSQLPTTSFTFDQNSRPIPADTAITNQLDWFRAGDSPEARETAAMYLRAADLRDSWRDNNLLERWQKPEYLEQPGPVPAADGTFDFGDWDDIDDSKIPPDEREAFRKAKEEVEKLLHDTEQAAIKLATEASLRPTCRFDFKVGQAEFYGHDPNNWRREINLGSLPTYHRISELRLLVWLTASPTSPERLMNVVTALRISAHIRSGQPSAVLINELQRERDILNGIGHLAFHDDVTNEQLRETVEQLETYFRARYLLDEALLADRAIIADVLRGKIYPLALAEGPNDKAAYLAFLANQFPWEQERGERALDLITLQNIRIWDGISDVPGDQQTSDLRNQGLRHLLGPTWVDFNRPQIWQIQQPAAATSYLTRFEYQARVRMNDLFRAIFDTEVYRRATLLQLALAMYRRDHNAYPKSLAELVPDYLPREPRDPFTNQSFQYVPQGLDLKLERRNYPYHDQIEPHTPLLWSVGLGNAQMKNQQRTSKKDGELDTQGEPLEATETIYELRSDDPQWWNEPTFIFPLPK